MKFFVFSSEELKVNGGRLYFILDTAPNNFQEIVPPFFKRCYFKVFLFYGNYLKSAVFLVNLVLSSNC